MAPLRRSQTRAGLSDSGIRPRTRSQTSHQPSSSSHPYGRKKLTPKQSNTEIMAGIASVCDIDDTPSKSDDTRRHSEPSEVGVIFKSKNKRSEPKPKPEERRQATRQSVRMALQRSQAEAERIEVKPTIQIKKEEEKIKVRNFTRSTTVPALAGKASNLKARGRTDVKRSRKVFEDPDISPDKGVEIVSDTSSPSSNVDSSTSFRPTKQRVVRFSTSVKRVAKGIKKMEEDHLSEEMNDDIPPSSLARDVEDEKTENITDNSSNVVYSARAEEKKDPQTHNSVDSSSGWISPQIEVTPLIRPSADPSPIQEGDRQNPSTHSRPQSESRSFDCRSFTSSDFALLEEMESHLKSQERSPEEVVSSPIEAQERGADPFKWAEEGTDLSSIRSDQSVSGDGEIECYDTHTSHAQEVEEDENWDRRAPSPGDDEIPFHPPGFRLEEEHVGEDEWKGFKVNYEFEERDLAGTPPPYLPEESELEGDERVDVGEGRLEVNVEEVEDFGGLDHKEEDVDMGGVIWEEQEDGSKDQDEDKENHPPLLKISEGKRSIGYGQLRPRDTSVEREDGNRANELILQEGREEPEAHEDVIEENKMRNDVYAEEPQIQAIMEDEGASIKVDDVTVDEFLGSPSRNSSAWKVTIYRPRGHELEHIEQCGDSPRDDRTPSTSRIEIYNPPIPSTIQESQVLPDETVPHETLPKYNPSSVILSPDSVPSPLPPHTSPLNQPEQNAIIPTRDQDIAQYHASSSSDLDPRLAHGFQTQATYNHTKAKPDPHLKVPIIVPRFDLHTTRFDDPDARPPPDATRARGRTASRRRGRGSGRGGRTATAGSTRGRGEARGRARGKGIGGGRYQSVTIPSLSVTSPGGSTQPLEQTTHVLQPTQLPPYKYWDRPTPTAVSATPIPIGHHTTYNPHPQREDTSALHLLADVALTEQENTNNHPRGTAGYWTTIMGITPQSTKLDVLAEVAANIDLLPRFRFNDDGTPRIGPPSILVHRDAPNRDQVEDGHVEPDGGSSTQPVRTQSRKRRTNSVRFSNYDRVAAVPPEADRPIIYQPVSAVREEPVPISAVRD